MKLLFIHFSSLELFIFTLLHSLTCLPLCLPVGVIGPGCQVVSVFEGFLGGLSYGFILGIHLFIITCYTYAIINQSLNFYLILPKI